MLAQHLTLAILTRNRPDCLRTALDAALATEEPPDDILVSDDSSDDVRPANRAIVDASAGVRYTEGPRAGLGANENHIVSQLLPGAEWVVFTGDDARLSPSFGREMRVAIAKHAPHRRIPTGTEVRNGDLVRPSAMSFFGFQRVPHASYHPGAPAEGIVVQATAFPVSDLRQLRWLEVTAYGYDEVDMTHKMRKLGWSFAFEPSITLDHDQSPVGRDEYPEPVLVARLYVRMRTFSVYDLRPLQLVAYAVLAPLQLIYAHIRRRNAAALRQVPRVVGTAYAAWWRSLRADWRMV
jgi:GT2 family glycosyltransferase